MSRGRVTAECRVSAASDSEYLGQGMGHGVDTRGWAGPVLWGAVIETSRDLSTQYRHHQAASLVRVDSVILSSLQLLGRLPWYGWDSDRESMVDGAG